MEESKTAHRNQLEAISKKKRRKSRGCWMRIEKCNRDSSRRRMSSTLRASNCESFETWGFTDKVSWLKEPKNALPFDKDYKKKKAYW